MTLISPDAIPLFGAADDESRKKVPMALLFRYMDHEESAASKESFVSKIDDGLGEGDGAGAGAGAGAGLGLGDTEAPTPAS